MTLCLSLFAHGASRAEANLADSDPLVHLIPTHPRLLMTSDTISQLKAAAKTDPLQAALQARIAAIAETQLNAPPLVHQLVGPRLLPQSRAAIERVLTCAMAYRLTADKRFLERAKYDLLTAAAFPDWNPSHFLDVAEMSVAVSIGYDWLHADLSAAERATLKQALLDKVLVFANGAYGPPKPTDDRLWWVTNCSNWNQVCNGGMLAAALALADEEPDLARVVVNGVRRSLPYALPAYRPDGAYPEGPLYWDYGTSYHAHALAMLETALGSCFELDAEPAFQRTVLYRLAVQGPTGVPFNYADCVPHSELPASFAWLAARFDQSQALAHSRAALESLVHQPVAGHSVDRFLALRAIWLSAPASAGQSAPLDLHFRGAADIAVFRSAWNDPAALFVGFKAGDNRAPHGHLDLGSFVLDAGGVRWAADLGPDYYNLPDYFDARGGARWQYFRLNNFSHNTLTPAKRLQAYQAVAPIVRFVSHPERAFAIADLTAVYPEAATKIERGIALLDRSRVLVQDEITGALPNTPLRWTMATEAAIELDAQGATLRQAGRQLRAEVLSPAGAAFRVVPATPPGAAENQNERVSLLVVDTASDSGTTTRLTVLLTPLRDAPSQLPSPAVVPLNNWQ